MLKAKPKPEMEWKAGRLILRGKLYSRMRRELYSLANEHCEKCGRWTSFEDGEADHIFGRGAGRRDDRIFVDGKRNLHWLCPDCHDVKHVPTKVVPPKPKLDDDEFKELMGL